MREEARLKPLVDPSIECQGIRMVLLACLNLVDPRARVVICSQDVVVFPVIGVHHEPIVLRKRPRKGFVVETQELGSSAVLGSVLERAVNVDFRWVIALAKLKIGKPSNLLA